MSHHFRAPVTKSYIVRDPLGNTIRTEVVPISNVTRNIPGRNSTATHQLLFEINLPPLGFATYWFETKAKNELDYLENMKSEVKITENEACTLQNQVKRNHLYVWNCDSFIQIESSR